MGGVGWGEGWVCPQVESPPGEKQISVRLNGAVYLHQAVGSLAPEILSQIFGPFLCVCSDQNAVLSSSKNPEILGSLTNICVAAFSPRVALKCAGCPRDPDSIPQKGGACCGLAASVLCAMNPACVQQSASPWGEHIPKPEQGERSRGGGGKTSTPGLAEFVLDNLVFSDNSKISHS